MRRIAAIAAVVVAAACSSSSDDGAPAPDAGTTSTTAPDSTTSGSPSTSNTTATTAPPSVPGASWTDTRAPVAAGLSEEGLAAVLGKNVEIGSDCFVIVQDGALVHEQYWNGADADSDTAIFSTTKSIASIIVGIAQDLGILDIEQPASDFITEWVGTDSEAVTIRSLLQNSSGRYYEFENDYVGLPGADDQSAFAIGLEQQASPDTEWFYNNSAIQTLEEVVERATGRDVEEFAQEHLFGPLGMDVTMGRDDAGNPGFYSGLRAGCLDMARFMLMVSRGGDWGGNQIVSADYVADAIAPATELNLAYGYLFWRNADPPWEHTDPRRDRALRFWPDAPIDAYMASGAADQVSMVFPSDDLLFVRLGPFGATAGYDGVVANDLAGLMVDASDG